MPGRQVRGLRSAAMIGVTAMIMSVSIGANAAPGDADPAAEFVEDPASLVNPFIGSKDDGNTFPGVSMPHGMVQLSPDTGHYAGYRWDQTEIRGFSLTHPQGVGCALGGDLPILGTTGELDSTDYVDYASSFSHDSEAAEAGYYSVQLDDYDVTAEVTATTRTGTQRYTYDGDEGHVLINAGQALHEVLSSDVRIVDDSTVEATIVGQGFCQDTEPYTLYTVTTIDREPSTAGTWEGDTFREGVTESVTDERNGAYFTFDTSDDEAVEVTTAISWVDMDGAYANLEAEGGADFDGTHAAAYETWNEALSQVAISGGSSEDQATFYSSLYRALMSPNTGSDVDGRYTGWDQEIHTAEDFTYYQTWSLWDTYRTQQQLLALLEPEASADMARSILLVAEQGGWLPRWGYATVETNIMTGDPVTPYLVSAYHQGLLAGHEEEAYEALVNNADNVPPADSPFNGRAGNEFYLEHGYVPHDPSAEKKPGDFDLHHGGSATLEYALADAMLATMAADLGHDADAQRYAARGQNFHNIFDPRTGSFRARGTDGMFLGSSDPAQSPGFHEGTAVQYTWLVQQDVPTLMDLLGGTDATNERLDDFFAYEQLLEDPAGTARDVWVNGPYDYYNQDKYNPQNEPNFHAPYIYLWSGQPWKTTDVVHAALTLFTDAPDGVTGNDDMGTMSSWHVLSAMGLFPIIPGTDYWGLTSPVFEEVRIDLDEDHYPGGDLTITAPGTDEDTRYIQGVELSGTALDRSYITGEDLRDGATIDFTVGNDPSEWAADSPPPAIDEATPEGDHLSMGVTPTHTAVQAGTAETIEVTAAVVATGAGTIDGTLEVTPEAPLSVPAETEDWSAESNHLPMTSEYPLAITVPADAEPGAYSVTVTATDERGLSETSEVTVDVVTPTGLEEYFNHVAIGDDGESNADFDGMGWYYSRQALEDAGTVQGATYELGETGLSWALGLAEPGEPDNISATGQTIDVTQMLDGASGFSFIGAGAGGDQGGTAELVFDDGTTREVDLQLTDWCAGEPAGDNSRVVRTAYRGAPDGTDNVACGLFATAPIELDGGSALTRITLPDAPELHVFALAHDATPAAEPIEVVPAEVTFVDEPGTDSDVIVVPESEGVAYLLDSDVLAAGEHPATGQVTVHAEALEGYVLAEGAQTSWSHEFSDAEEPTDEPTDDPTDDPTGEPTGEPTSEPGDELPTTGAAIGGIGLLAGLLTAGGLVLAQARRRRA